MKLHLLALLFCPLFLFGKSGAEHINDMTRIFPFAKSNQEVIQLYKTINEYLDKPNGKNVGHPLFIKENPKLAKMTFGNHRIWYHWGFNTDPKKFNQLVDVVNKNIAEGKLKKDNESVFWSSLMTEVGKRNKELMNEASLIFGYGQLGSISSQQRGQLNGFVTILYSIHLIGDHTTTRTQELADLKMVYTDIYRAIDNLAGNKYSDNVQKAKKIKAELKPHESNPEAYLNQMEKSFSPFLLSLKNPLYNYKEKFDKMGYRLK